MYVIRHMTFGRSPRHCHMFASERNESEGKRARRRKEGKGGREEEGRRGGVLRRDYREDCCS